LPPIIMSASRPSSRLSTARPQYSQQEKAERRDAALEIVQSEGLPPIIGRCRSGTPAEKEKAAAILSFIATHDAQCALTIVAAGGIPPLIAMMKAQNAGLGDEDPKYDMREQAVLTIADLVEADASNQLPVAERGAIAPLLDIMDDQGSPWSIREAGARALALLAKETSGGPAQEDLTDNNGVHRLVECYKLAGCSQACKGEIKLCLRYLAAYTPAKTQMMQMGILKAREQSAAGDDPFEGLSQFD